MKLNNSAIIELRERRLKLANEMGEWVAKAEKEDRGFTEDERTKWDKAKADIEALDQRTKDLEDALEIAAKEVEERAPAGDDARGHHKAKADDGSEYQRAFNSYLRGYELTPEERGAIRNGYRPGDTETRAQTTTTTGGGYTIPTGFVNSVEAAMKDYSGVLETEGMARGATVLRTATGNALPFPTSNDTGNSGALLAENTQDSTQDLVFGQMTLNAYLFTSKIVLVPIQLLQDEEVELEPFIGARFGERLGRAVGTELATGSGSSRPKGFVPCATDSSITAASATAVTYPELMSLKYSVNRAYRRNGMWAFGDGAEGALRAMVDGDSRPLWKPGMADGAPDTIDGDPYFVDQAMPAMTTGQKAFVYGDFSKFQIRIVREMTMVRLVERYADYHQVGFVAFTRIDSDLLDAGTNPIKYMAMA